MSFGSLLETALAGSQRRPVVGALSALDDKLPPERRLLRSASYEGLRRLAGRPPDPIPDVIATEPCGPEAMPRIPPAAAARVLDILTNRPALLVEWLRLAAAGKWRLSHDCLPEVLAYARSHADVHHLVIQVGGERLSWLAALNPEWHFAARIDPEDLLATGAPEERVRALHQIRQRDARRGRALLEAVLDSRSERAENRAALLAALAEGLSAEDEPLLLQAVEHPRKDLRDTGLRLIRRISDSRFGQRWSERACQVMNIVESPPGLTIEVREPGAPDPAWIRDGLDPRPPKGIGATAWMLQQVLALTPPSIWPLAVLPAIQRSVWSQPLLSGLAQAAVGYADADWCEALLTARNQTEAVRGVHSAALLGALVPDRAEAVVRRLLDDRARGVGSLAASLRHPWSESFSRLLLGRLPELLGEQHYATSSLLHEAPLRLEPGVLPEAKDLLENHLEPVWARLGLERLLSTLEFRVAMRTELEPA